MDNQLSGSLIPGSVGLIEDKSSTGLEIVVLGQEQVVQSKKILSPKPIAVISPTKKTIETSASSPKPSESRKTTKNMMDGPESGNKSMLNNSDSYDSDDEFSLSDMENSPVYAPNSRLPISFILPSSALSGHLDSKPTACRKRKVPANRRKWFKDAILGEDTSDSDDSDEFESPRERLELTPMKKPKAEDVSDAETEILKVPGDLSLSCNSKFTFSQESEQLQSGKSSPQQNKRLPDLIKSTKKRCPVVTPEDILNSGSEYWF